MNRKLAILYWVFFLQFGFLAAQDPHLVDSLRHELAGQTIRDTSLFDKQYKLAATLLYAAPQGEALTLAKAATQLADSLLDTLRLAKATNLMANCYKNSGLNDKAMLQYIKAMDLFQAIGDQKWIANMHSNIAVMYLNKGDYAQSKKEQEIALEIRERIHYYKGISGVYNGLGNLYDQLGKPKESLRYYQMAFDSSAREGSPYDRATFLGNIGNAYGRLKQYDISREINFQALEIHRQMGLKQEMSRDLHNIGETYLLQKKGDSAVHYLELAYRTADSIHYHLVQAVSSDNLKEYYKSAGKYDIALKWSEIAFKQYDTLHQLQMTGESQAQEVAYRVEQEEREEDFAREASLLQKDADIKRQTIINWSMGIGLLLLGGFGFVVSKRYREKKQANAILEEKVAERTGALQQSNARLVDEVQQKERASKTLSTFIYRSSHDLKGPLTSIKGLVNVAKTQGAGVNYIDHIGAKANQLDGVLQQLIDKVEVDAKVPERQPIDLETLWADLTTELSQRAGYDQVKIETDFSKAEGMQADPMLLKLVLRQLVYNAIDFRSEAGWIRVVAGMNPKGKWKLSVEDNGIGIPADQQDKIWEMFYRGSNASKGAGLGLYLVKEAAAKMGAEVHLRSPFLGSSAEPKAAGTFVKLIWD